MAPKYISAKEIRAYFNEGRYVDLVSYGVLKTKLIREGPAGPSANQPPGTKSQVIAYLDSSSKQVAVVHQYVTPAGTLGGSGKPDPKRLLHNGTLYVLDETK